MPKLLNVKSKRIEFICPTCSIKFSKFPCDVTKNNFCSKKCMRQTTETKNKISEKHKNENNPLWKGDNAGIEAIHIWVRNRFKKTELCQNCKLKPPIDLANISQEYKRDISDWKWLCRKCHMEEDGRLRLFIKRNKFEEVDMKDRILPLKHRL